MEAGLFLCVRILLLCSVERKRLRYSPTRNCCFLLDDYPVDIQRDNRREKIKVNIASLIERIRKDYIGDVDLEAGEKNEDVEKKYEDIFSVFVLALRMKDRELVKLLLNIIRKYQERSASKKSA